MRDMRVYLLPLIVSGILLAVPSAQANHRTDLTSAADEGDPYDVNVSVGYSRTLFKGSIKREALGPSHTGGTALAKELTFANIRHVLSVRADLAVFRDLQFHIELPVILSDSRSLKLAENGGDSCGVQAWEHCVTKENSTLIRDGFMPDKNAFPAGMAGAMVGSNDGPSGGFLLPNRSGLDQLFIGLTWAPLNQNRDATKPTWIIGFEARVAVGDPMEYNPWVYDSNTDSYGYSADKADDNTAVGQGLHHFHFFMTLSRRFKYVDPWMTIFYFLPMATKDSLYKQSDWEQSGQERHDPQQRGGVEAGLEIIPWEDKERDMKIGIDLFARLEGVFEGRGYSPMWEVFANNPILNGPCRRTAIPAEMGGKVVDRGMSKWQNGTFCEDGSVKDKDGVYIPYPGISSIENHAVFKGGLSVKAQITKWFWASLGLGLGHEQAHFITFGDTGKDRNQSGQIERFYMTPSEVDAIKKGTLEADPGPYDEINPVYRPYIDLAGRRFRVTDTTIFDVMVAVKGMF